jgi:hypothetical protein
MRPLIFAITLLAASTAHAQFPYNPIAHAQRQYARLQSGSAYPYFTPGYVPYRPYGAYLGGYGGYEVAREMRLQRWAIEDAAFDSRWSRFNRSWR